MATTSANKNRAIRQQALRDQLSSQGHVQHVIDISNKLSKLDEGLDSLQIQRLKAAADIKKGLISKYLPDIKMVELTGEGGDPIKTDFTVTIVNAKPNDTQ